MCSRILTLHLTFAIPEQVRRGHTISKIRRILEIGRGEIQHFGDAIHQHPEQH